MTRHSQNGWPVVGKSACDQGPFLGVTFPNGILVGDVATIARWQLGQYVATVEPLRSGTCWGWFDKPIEGSAVTSNHASATAWDINADQHPMGTPASQSMSTREVAACRAIVAAAAGVLRWGGDYSGRPDPMHWEINAGPDQVHAFAIKITRKVTMTKIETAWPAIGQGDSDDQLPGYNVISRMQKITGATADGDWGPDTTAKIAAWVGIPTSKATKMTEDIYRKVLGLSEA